MPRWIDTFAIGMSSIACVDCTPAREQKEVLRGSDIGSDDLKRDICQGSEPPDLFGFANGTVDS